MDFFSNPYLVATEGEKTEEIYFNIFRTPEYRKNIQVKILSARRGNSSPKAVMKRLQSKAREMDLQSGDELWVVIDDDKRPKEQLQVIVNECKEKHNYFFAISNPCFELWLLLHQKNYKAPPTPELCEQELAKLFEKPYDKTNYEVSKLEPYIKNAIAHAQKLDTTDIPKEVGTGVYRLVEKLIKK
ncbi:RloB family protein [Dactylococcopsis salina]|uniref:RloB-like protein n=1 Tax=Dactylococcopsis salina (strain PCC 8305) TaxID=13035 RepID=K9Z077_DACS8|nr:RloB family protein [Dactylococcopsis salina]AFZ51763.1 hypothetical protein Dacsa_3244 [Dactylococcopsis salina PCC 8305]